MQKLRVLVVEDSLTIRKRLVEVLGSDPGLEVVGEAADGKQGIELCRMLRPDVMTLDMMLPIMTGVAVTEYVMAYCPTPILIVSSSTNRGDLFRTYDALAAGALDVLEKPMSNEIDAGWERRLVSMVKLIGRIKVITHLRAKLAPERTHARDGEPRRAPASGGARPRLIALGASTGGPAAVLEILKGLPPQFPIPILFVIHLGRLFAGAFADWLSGQSPFAVAYAQDSEPLPRVGTPRVVMAPPDRHLVLEGGKLRLTNGAERHSCRPSVDVLFESMARDVAPECLACLLTGMGRDGAEGLLAIRRAGGITIAQDEATSVVYGMPREAVMLDAAMHVLPVQRFASTMMQYASAAG